ncbi:hypothetical protein AGMMS50229_14690 [Campylobacterota bacterium]|nr:hypothetical protein AGMMS50229_14690 [Campylobacterota bacterium]
MKKLLGLSVSTALALGLGFGLVGCGSDGDDGSDATAKLQLLEQLKYYAATAPSICENGSDDVTIGGSTITVKCKLLVVDDLDQLHIPAGATLLVAKGAALKLPGTGGVVSFGTLKVDGISSGTATILAINTDTATNGYLIVDGDIELIGKNAKFEIRGVIDDVSDGSVSTYDGSTIQYGNTGGLYAVGTSINVFKVANVESNLTAIKALREASFDYTVLVSVGDSSVLERKTLALDGNLILPVINTNDVTGLTLTGKEYNSSNEEDYVYTEDGGELAFPKTTKIKYELNASGEGYDDINTTASVIIPVKGSGGLALTRDVKLNIIGGSILTASTYDYINELNATIAKSFDKAKFTEGGDRNLTAFKIKHGEDNATDVNISLGIGVNYGVDKNITYDFGEINTTVAPIAGHRISYVLFIDSAGAGVDDNFTANGDFKLDVNVTGGFAADARIGTLDYTAAHPKIPELKHTTGVAITR